MDDEIWKAEPLSQSNPLGTFTVLYLLLHSSRLYMYSRYKTLHREAGGSVTGISLLLGCKDNRLMSSPWQLTWLSLYSFAYVIAKTEGQRPLLVTTELCFMMEMMVSHLQEINSPQESLLSSEHAPSDTSMCFLGFGWIQNTTVSARNSVNFYGWMDVYTDWSMENKCSDKK